MSELLKEEAGRVPLLSCKDIVKRFPVKKQLITGRILKYFTAVNGVSLELYPGETLGIVGESGSGKSTVSEVIGDLQKPTEGQVFYKGKDIRTLTPSEYSVYRRNVQFVFQDPKGSLNPNATVEEILTEPLITLGLEPDAEKRRKKAEELIQAVGLEQSVLNKFPSAVSGGQCQRIVIARALITEPEVIICDEAVSALDVSIQAQILNLLKDLQDRTGVAYIFISHDIGVVDFMADRLAVMLHGEVAEQGIADDIIVRPKEEYTRKLIESCFAEKE